MSTKRPNRTRKGIKKKSIDSQPNRVKLAIENKDQRYLKMTVRQEPHPPHKTTLQNRGQEKKEKKRKEKKMMVKKRDLTIWNLAVAK